MDNKVVTAIHPPLRGTERVSTERISSSSRLLSLDVLRGLTVACMVMVNNGYGESFSTLEHSKWNGMTPCDLVFPFFLFMVGVSIFLSLSKHAGEKGQITKILRRTLILFVMGVALHAWDMLIWGEAADIPGHLRFWGVLQRIALSYCFASLLFIAFKGRYLWRTTILLLLVYALILIFGNGYSTNPDDNLLAIVDRNLFGNHLYAKALDGRSPIDPEGLRGVIAGTAHALVGVICGRALCGRTTDHGLRTTEGGQRTANRVLNLLVIACTMGIIGYLLSYALPLNKRVWSPSYVLVTCSLAASALGLFTYVIDLKGHNRWCRIFQMFGVNAFFLYVVSEMIPSVFGQLGISDAIYSFWSMIFSVPQMASLGYALTYVAVMALLAFVLFKKKIFIKI